jgi:nicotinamidase/pyrazinamidase
VIAFIFAREMMPVKFEPSDALIIVDMQNDFCPGGALAVSEGDAVIPALNRLISKAREAGVPVYASRDWHPADHMSFAARGGPWPPHCVQNTEGAAFHPDLRLPKDTILVTKGTDPDAEAYSAFEGTDLEQRLREAGIKRIWIGGLTQDYCVKESTLDAIRAGLEVHVILKATRPVNARPEDGAKALEAMKRAGAVIESGDV